MEHIKKIFSDISKQYHSLKTIQDKKGMDNRCNFRYDEKEAANNAKVWSRIQNMTQ